MGVVSKPTTNDALQNIIGNIVPLKVKTPKNTQITNKTIFSKSTPYLKKLSSIYTVTKLEKPVTTMTKNQDIPTDIASDIHNTPIFQSIQNTSQTTNTSNLPTPVQTQIYLAAGIRVDVSSQLDLGGHTKSDASERLKECVINGYILGWHNIHVLTGCEEIGQIVIDLLKSSTGQYIARYAQAPIQMGGPNAWILYFN